MLLFYISDLKQDQTVNCLYPPDGKWYTAKIIKLEKGKDIKLLLTLYEWHVFSQQTAHCISVKKVFKDKLVCRPTMNLNFVRAYLVQVSLYVMNV